MKLFDVYVKNSTNPRDRTWDIVGANMPAHDAGELAVKLAVEGAFERIEISRTTARRK